MHKRTRTFSYIIFYLLFWPDTWRIVIGIAASFFLAPLIMPPDLGLFGTGMFYVMLATIGYSVSALPARRFTHLLKRLILGDKLSS